MSTNNFTYTFETAPGTGGTIPYQTARGCFGEVPCFAPKGDTMQAFHLVALEDDELVAENRVILATSLEKAKQTYAVDMAKALQDHPDFEIIRVQ